MTNTSTPERATARAEASNEDWFYTRDDDDDGTISYAIHRKRDYEFIANLYTTEKDAKRLIEAVNTHDALQAENERLTKALEDERERCADIVDALFQKYQRSPDSWAKGWRSACAEIEEQIRALSPPSTSQSEGEG
mgnify:CR=1 FL=1